MTPALRRMKKRRRIIPHCWVSKSDQVEFGSKEWDEIFAYGGCDASCMLLEGHEGPHMFVPDNEIGVEFKPGR